MVLFGTRSACRCEELLTEDFCDLHDRRAARNDRVAPPSHLVGPRLMQESSNRWHGNARGLLDLTERFGSILSQYLADRVARRVEPGLHGRRERSGKEV